MNATKLNKGDDSKSALSPRPFARMRKRRRTGPTPSPPSSEKNPTSTTPTVFNVRPNPPHYVVNMSENSTSTEWQVADAFVKEGARCISVVGLPGCGKTVLLRAVAHCPAVQRVFRDCVALFGLDEATSDEFLRDLCEVMGKVCGLSKLAIVRKILLHPNSHERAIEEVARAFSGRHVLLLFDAVGVMESPVYKLVYKLIEVAASHQSFPSVLISTRSVTVANTLATAKYVFALELLDPRDSRAKDIIRAHAGFARDSFETLCEMKDNSVSSVVQKCSGLPLALAVAGGAVKRLLSNATDEPSRAVIWIHYRKYLYNNFDQFGEISGLYRSFSVCAATVAELKGWPKGLMVQVALAALNEMKSGLWISLTILQKLWNLKTKGEVIATIDCLADFRLVSRVDKKRVVGIQIPAIILDYCRYEAAKVARSEKGCGATHSASSSGVASGKKRDPREAHTAKVESSLQTGSVTLKKGAHALGIPQNMKDDRLWAAVQDRHIIKQ